MLILVPRAIVYLVTFHHTLYAVNGQTDRQLIWQIEIVVTNIEHFFCFLHRPNCGGYAPCFLHVTCVNTLCRARLILVDFALESDIEPAVTNCYVRYAGL